MEEKFSVGLWAFSVTVDRVCTDGYKDQVSKEKKFELASRVEGLNGIELHYPTEFPDGDVDKTKELLETYKLECCNVMVDYYKREFMNGSVAAYDDKTWKKAVKIAQEAMDAAVVLGPNLTTICPTHDGYDYPFQSDYTESYDRVVRAIKEIAGYNPKVRLGIEYKPRETRAHIVTRSVDRALVLIDEAGLENVGITMDVGHALFGQENPAESAHIASRYGKLFHLHLNDNHAIWDDDMTFGTVHFWEAVELVAWLGISKYDGWYSFDIYPYREDPIRATEENIANLKLMMELTKKVDMKTLREKMLRLETTEITRQLREELFK